MKLLYIIVHINILFHGLRRFCKRPRKYNLDIKLYNVTMDGCSTFCIHKRSLQSQTDDTIISITKITLLKLVLWLVNVHFTVSIICIVKICANRSRMGTEIVIAMEFRKPYLTIVWTCEVFWYKKSVFAFSRLMTIIDCSLKRIHVKIIH